MIALGSPLEDVLESWRLLSTVRRRRGCAASCLLDPGRRRFSGRWLAPRMPRELLRAIAGMPIGPNSGACGTAAYRRQTSHRSGCGVRSLFDDYRELLLSLGLRSCWSTPILSSEGLALGTMGVSARAASHSRAGERSKSWKGPPIWPRLRSRRKQYRGGADHQPRSLSGAFRKRQRHCLHPRSGGHAHILEPRGRAPHGLPPRRSCWERISAISSRPSTGHSCGR